MKNNMRKSEVISTLRKQRVVAVVRGNGLEEGLHISRACINGGLKAIEMTYTNASASEIIQQLSKEYENDPEVLIGAGTVLDDITARMAILAGAKYIVSPSFDQKTALLFNRYGIAYIPGCMTVTEIVTAMEAGSEMIKLFPGSAFGPKYISSLHSPLPQASIMVTGGVQLENVADWLKAGADAVGIGGEFNRLGAKGEYEEIEGLAKEYATCVKGAQKA